MDVSTAAINLTPLLLDILVFAGVVLAAVATWAINKYIGSHLDDKAKALLETAIQNGIAYAEKKAGEYFNAHPVGLDSHNAMLNAAGSYVVENVPGALTRLGVTQEQLTQKIVARLPQ